MVEATNRSAAQSGQPLPNSHWPYKLVFTGEPGLTDPNWSTKQKSAHGSRVCPRAHAM